MEQLVKLPYGDGFCVLLVDYTPEEFPLFSHESGYGEPGIPAEAIITKFLVGGVDILDELLDMYVPSVYNGNVKYEYYLDEFVAKNWEEIVKQCEEEDDV